MDIFTSEAALLPDFSPEQPLHREAQLREMEAALKPVLKNMQPDNLFLYGSTGAGKTTCVKHICKELNEYRPKVNCVYINCWDNNTKLSILNAVALSMQIGFPRRGIAGDEVFARIIELSKKSKTNHLVFLDEFDQLFLNKEAGVVYDLTRANENYGVNFGVVLISNEAALLETLDQRMKSSLSSHKIEFPRYSPLELKNILRERAKLCFRSGAWSEEVIALCAAHAAKQGGDCRIALRCLWRAARLAESKGSEIKEKHVRQAFSPEKETHLASNETEKKIITILQQNPDGLTSGELYGMLEREMTSRSVRNHLDNLEKRSVVEIKEVEGKEAGGRGRSRVVKLK